MSEIIDILRDNFESVDMEKAYDDFLDEVYSFNDVGGPFATMSPARVLQEVSPIDYNVGFSDFASSEDFIEEEGEYWHVNDYKEAEEIYEDQQYEEEPDDDY